MILFDCDDDILVVGCGWVGPYHCCECNYVNCVFTVLSFPGARELVEFKLDQPNLTSSRGQIWMLKLDQNAKFEFEGKFDLQIRPL